jgi:TPP-dependent pyruvate/acetoin dehydrogenase alpha subunit
MIAACTDAVEHARAGKGPYLIEAITYRMSVHTTADDPRVYRSDEEVEYWKTRDPLYRFRAYLKKNDILSASEDDRIHHECEQEVRDARESFRRKAVANPREVFDYMFEDLPPELQRQRDEYFAKLRRKGLDTSH